MISRALNKYVQGLLRDGISESSSFEMISNLLDGILHGEKSRIQLLKKLVIDKFQLWMKLDTIDFQCLTSMEQQANFNLLQSLDPPSSLIDRLNDISVLRIVMEEGSLKVEPTFRIKKMIHPDLPKDSEQFILDRLANITKSNSKLSPIISLIEPTVKQMLSNLNRDTCGGTKGKSPFGEFDWNIFDQYQHQFSHEQIRERLSYLLKDNSAYCELTETQFKVYSNTSKTIEYVLHLASRKSASLLDLTSSFKISPPENLFTHVTHLSHKPLRGCRIAIGKFYHKKKETGKS
jgi:hypothetical protein